MSEMTDQEKIRAEIDRLWDDEGQSGTTLGEFKAALAEKVLALVEVANRAYVECDLISCRVGSRCANCANANAALAGFNL